MKLQSLINKHALPLTVLDVSTWPDIETSLLDDRAQKRYQRFKQAIILIVRNHINVSAAAREYGIDRSELDRILGRCFEPLADGQIAGFRVLVPYTRLKSYERGNDTNHGTAGLLESLLEKFPDIKAKLWKEYNDGKSISEIRTLLLEELLPSVGWPTHRYPYNTVTKGREALRKYFIRLDKKNTEKALIINEYSENQEIVIRPYQRVQFDAHRCDAHFVIHLDGPDGLSRTSVTERIWLLVLIDVASRAVLGYSISLNRQCNIPDVLEAIHTAVVPQKRHILTIPGLEYRPGAGLPNQLISSCEWQLFDLICFDNAMAHRSERLHQIVNEKTQSSIKLNRSKTPNDNAFIERFFGTLTAHGFKRTPSTTGSGPDDPICDNPEEKAEHYEFTLNDAEQLLDVLIANYNVELHRGIYTTPIEYIRTYYKEIPKLLRHVSISERKNWSLRELWVEVTVRGNNNDIPYVQYLDAMYKSKILASRHDLIKQKIFILINFDDLRTVNAFLPNSQFLGALNVSGRWALTKHSLKTRQLIIKLSREGEINVGYKDPVRALNSYLQIKSRESKWARNQLARLQREMERKETPLYQKEMAEPTEEIQDCFPSKDDWISFRTPVYD